MNSEREFFYSNYEIIICHSEQSEEDTNFCFCSLISKDSSIIVRNHLFILLKKSFSTSFVLTKDFRGGEKKLEQIARKNYVNKRLSGQRGRRREIVK